MSPLLSSNEPVDWMFAFKFNAQTMPGSKMRLRKTGVFDAKGIKRPCYDEDNKKFSRHYVVASSNDQKLKLGKGNDVIGASVDDPLGATFGQVYLADPSPYFVVWNDQFYGHPLQTELGPWGHSKGMLAWDDSGEGFVLQVSTPSWPGAGNKKNPRQNDGNTLGFVEDDNIKVSQHFFALKLNKKDVELVLKALANASVKTDPSKPSIVHNGGPATITSLVNDLGQLQNGTEVMNVKLSSGARLISKPSALHVPPWHLVSAELGGVDLRVASWWERYKDTAIYSTTRESPVPECWDKKLGKPGAVQIATTGLWKLPLKNDKVKHMSIGLTGGPGPMYNHAKLGISTSDGKTYSIFGDMNQEGSLFKENANVSQNGRGGLFFVMNDKKLYNSMTDFLHGDSAATTVPLDKI